MIARHWRGWTRLEDADGYEAFLKTKLLPGLREIEGHRGAYVLRLNGADESEFVVINFFDSIEAVKQIAGEDYGTATFEPEAKAFLSRIEPFASHYEVRERTVIS
jgi:heme-degrading monooxygenase HmoA